MQLRGNVELGFDHGPDQQVWTRKTAVAGFIISLVGTALWIYGYFSTGSPPLIDWQARTPWWIAKFLPNLQSEIGVGLMCVGMVLSYWPARQE